jgi:hypothetical protein
MYGERRQTDITPAQKVTAASAQNVKTGEAMTGGLKKR